MSDEAAMPGTVEWIQETSGWLTSAHRRALLRPLLSAHVRNVWGRLGMAVGLHPGPHAYIRSDRLTPPNTTLTRTAGAAARRDLPVALFNHSCRTYTFGRALGELEGIDVDCELLFASAMLHDVGLVTATGDADFTLTSSRLARDVAEQVGLSTAATHVMQTAITMHHSPGVDASAGPVAYLLSAGAALDVVGLRSWELPPDVMSDAVLTHARADFNTVFGAAFRREAARVPAGRVKLLYRYGAFGAAIRWSPFDE